MSPPLNDHIRAVDQSVLELLQQYSGRADGPADSNACKDSAANGVSDVCSSTSTSDGGLTVQDMTDQLDVTPTAVRQRLERLTQAELIERRKVSVGRGRPQYRYYLTKLGARYAAASYADLATALWQELMDLPNPQQRSRVLRRVAKRMGEGLGEQLPSEATVKERMLATVNALGKRKIAASLLETDNLPVLEVQSCPYPEISEHADGRQLCEMEQEMLSEAIGEAMQLDCCRLDGHGNCQFRPVTSAEN